MSRVILDNVAKSYPGPAGQIAHALRDLSLEIDSGECVVLLGPSGCGKTTTLRLVAGLETEDAGAVRIDGRDMAGVPPQDREVAMVFQHFALYPHLRVAENLTLGLKLRKVPDAEIGSRLQKSAELLSLTGLLDRLPKELSGGERQRVAIGRAIMRRPKVLLFDEPLSNLDAPLRAQLREAISTLHHQSGTTLLYVTHDQAEAMALAGRIAVLKDGRLQQCAKPQVIHHRPANLFVAGFVGSPPMNLFRGAFRHDGAALTFAPAELAPGTVWVLPGSVSSRMGALVGRELVLGLRPEHFQLNSEGDVRGKVEMIEPLGSETVLRVRAGGLPFAVRLPPGPAPRREELVNLRLDWEAASLFDSRTGNVLETGPELTNG